MFSCKVPTWTLIAILPILLSSCSNWKKSSTYQPPESSGKVSEGEQALTSMTVSAVDLYHHDPNPTLGEVKKPTIWLHAEKFHIIDDNNWKIEDITAVIYDTKDGVERVRISAESGTFDKMRSASLSGKIHAEMEGISFQTDSLLWTNKTEAEPAKITSGGKVSVEGDGISLTCSSLVIYPDAKTFELTDVSGVAPLVLRET
ncbi:MAG: hypothetical protein N3G21_09045 [Candidatus Hydrogenedentes bacterium]|nr:hypothetical protein [Candidatus Hydrogenedentota bacterium]